MPFGKRFTISMEGGGKNGKAQHFTFEWENGRLLKKRSATASFHA